MTEKPRCLVQSATPGRATLEQATDQMRALRDVYRTQISMPAQDHLSNCYDRTIASLLRLQEVERACAKVGHPWRYSPFTKLSNPPMVERLCLTCRRLELLIVSEVPPGAVTLDESTWAHLVHGERLWS